MVSLFRMEQPQPPVLGHRRQEALPELHLVAVEKPGGGHALLGPLRPPLPELPPLLRRFVPIAPGPVPNRFAGTPEVTHSQPEADRKGLRVRPGEFLPFI